MVYTRNGSRTKSNASARADTLLFAREDSSKVKQIETVSSFV